MFADVADYSEWKTGRRATGIVFATIGFALKAGLSLGAFRGWLTAARRYGYQANADADRRRRCTGIRLMVSVYPGASCSPSAPCCLVRYKINKQLTMQIADDLDQAPRLNVADAALTAGHSRSVS